jgi:uncharacterized protein (TIGR04255 family)
MSFSNDFVSLDTSNYIGRGDFCSRLDEVVAAYSEIVKPPRAVRIGIRYTNRIEDSDLVEALPRLIRAEVLGTAAVNLPEGAKLVHHLSQAQYRFADRGLTVNWGKMPPNAVLDQTLPPVPVPTWTLDLDAFSDVVGKFSAAEIGQTERELALSAYRYFAWAVTDEYRSRFGGAK